MRLARNLLLGLLVVAVLLWPADWLVWRLRGSPVDQVEVTRYVVAPLKGGKEEYYPDGTTTLTCSRSALPQTSDGVCWRVNAHRVVFDR